MELLTPGTAWKGLVVTGTKITEQGPLGKARDSLDKRIGMRGSWEPPYPIPVQREGAHEQGHHNLRHEGAGQEGDRQQGQLSGPWFLDVAQLQVDALHDFWDLVAARSRQKEGSVEKLREKGRWETGQEQGGGWRAAQGRRASPPLSAPPMPGNS